MDKANAKAKTKAEGKQGNMWTTSAPAENDCEDAKPEEAQKKAEEEHKSLQSQLAHVSRVSLAGDLSLLAAPLLKPGLVLPVGYRLSPVMLENYRFASAHWRKLVLIICRFRLIIKISTFHGK